MSLLALALVLAGLLDAPSPTPTGTATTGTPSAASPTPASPAATPGAGAPTPIKTPALPRVGIVVSGEAGSAAAQLQKELEKALATRPAFSVRSSSELASKLVVARPTQAAGLDEATKAEAGKLLEAAKGAFYDDASPQALDRLAKLEELQDRTAAFPAAQRIELRLWRVAVFLALKDEQAASDEALAALSIDPTLTIDLKELPPSVGDAVDKVRKTRLKVVTVIVSGLPPVAEVTSDGRSVPPRFRAASGHHHIVARSPGRLEAVRDIEVDSDTSISMPLALAIPGDAQTALNAALWADPAATPADPAPLAALALKLNLDWLVLVALHADQARALVISPTAKAPAWTGPIVSGATMGTVLGDSIGAAVIHAIQTPDQVARTPSGPETPGWHTSGRGSLVAAGSYRNLSGRVKTFFAGTGPFASVESRNGDNLLGLEAGWVTYGPSTLDVTLPDGTSHAAGGGSTLSLSAGGGRRLALSAEGEDGLMFRYGLWIDVDDHSATEVKTAAGGNLGLLASYLRIAPEARVGVMLPIRSAGPLTMVGELGLAPIGLWMDQPRTVYGSSASASPAFDWRVGALWGTGSLKWAATWTGESIGASHKGVAQVPSNPPLTSVSVSETVQTIGIGIVKKF